MKTLAVTLMFLMAFHPPAQAEDSPRVGRGAAAKYFENKDPDATEEKPASGESSRSSDHYLALHVGKMMSSTAYEWGTENKQTDVGDFTAGVTYRVGEWKNSMGLKT